MRLIVPVLCALGAALAVASIPAGGTVRPHPQASALELTRTAADSLLARHTEMPQGGWAWRSAIQAPHYQTDRDVGAASVGEGLLAAYAVTNDRRYLRGASRAGDYLLAVAEPAEGGLRWPDWADANGRRSDTHYTSFDDGAAGISDFLWKLSEATGASRFRTGSLAGMRWVVSQAQGDCPRTTCSWRWSDDPDSVSYYGVGMGDAGIVLALDAFADRTADPSFGAYARAGAAGLRELTHDGSRPLPRGSDDSTEETGYLSGSAGAAYMFLSRYTHDQDPADLAAARGLLGWVNDQAMAHHSGGLRWPLAADDRTSASGFELGVAGIAWVNTQAARITGDRSYAEVARRAGVWLRHATVAPGAWRELPGDGTSPQHIGLDSGAAGIGWVLHDLSRSGIEPLANRTAARAARSQIRSAAVQDRVGHWWYENRARRRGQYRGEPSWHWGSAGIAAFGARLAGWSDGTPGGQP